jgi:ADP-heptose:LPS heptosyltransferase
MPNYRVHRAVMRLVASLDRRRATDIGNVDVRSICVVNTTALGDTLLSTPAIRAVRHAYREARLVSLVHRRSLDVLRHNPHLDDIIEYPGKYKGVWKLLGRLRSERFDLVVILHANDPDVVPLVYFSGAPLRAGWAESQMDFLLTHTYRRPTDPPGHTIENRFGVLAAVGIPPDGVAMEMHYGPEERDFADRFLADFQIDPAKETVVGLHPFASRTEKAWPAGHALDLLRRLESKSGVRPLVVGGGKHRHKAEEWRVKLPPKVPLAIGMGSIAHTAALIDQCDLFVTTDSGPFHVAVARGVPTIMLVGPTEPRVTGPYQDRERHTVLTSSVACPECAGRAERVQHTCMASLTTERVMAAIKERLQVLHNHA